MNKRISRQIKVGEVLIGGSRKPVIQTMTKTPTADVPATLQQINEAKAEGAQLIRVAIKDRGDLSPFAEIVKNSSLSVIADVHFDNFLAFKALEAGAAAIRINPGNFGSLEKLKDLLKLADERGAAIRIGVNSGSLEKKYRSQTELSLAERMVNSAIDWIHYFEDRHFFNLKISVKSSSLRETVSAYRLLAERCDYPLHIGLTESGVGVDGVLKSFVAIGTLLLDGIGDTLRISLTAPPQVEIQYARKLLRILEIEPVGLELISCPTCGRASVNLVEIVENFYRQINKLKFSKRIKVALMGCEVNGPGEAADADLGIAFSQGNAFLFKNGALVAGNLKQEEALEKLLALLKECCEW